MKPIKINYGNLKKRKISCFDKHGRELSKTKCKKEVKKWRIDDK